MGGSALQWRVTLLDDLVPSSFVQVDVSMRKLGEPAVVIGWELILVEPSGTANSKQMLSHC